MEQEKPHILSFKSQILILVVLIILTFLEIWVTKIDIGPFSLAAVLVLAAIQVYIVMAYHMHLKYETLFYRIMVASLFILFVAVLFVTLSDYIFR